MSADSRIVVVARTLEQARSVVRRLKLLVDRDDRADLPPSNPIPWTIANKYYTADVHFHLVEYGHWDAQTAAGVPAVMYVWERGEPYADHILTLARHVSEDGPEVVLAVGVGPQTAHAEDPPEGPDQFLAEHGFEYIDADHPHTTPETVQGLPRVIDALSTVMWPSMVRAQSSTKRASQMPMLFDVLPEEDTLAALLTADAVDHGGPLSRATRMHREMAELERWLVETEEMHELEQDDDDDDSTGEPQTDPWKTTDLPPATGSTAAHGFDDDFSEFVSAPASLAAPPQIPAHTGASWQSLHSDLDPDFDDEREPEQLGYETLDDHFFTHRSAASGLPTFGFPDDPEFDAPFDLTKILSTLEGVRDGVSGIQDPDARRAYSARIASNIVVQSMKDEPTETSDGEPKDA